MGEWLSRLDDIRVTREEVVGRLTHRVRVAWITHQLTEVSAKFSRYYFSKAGFARPLQIARRFCKDCQIDAQEIGEVLVKLDRVAEALESEEGYPADISGLGRNMLFCIINPDPREDTQFGDPVCHLPIDPEVVSQPRAYSQCAASAAFLVSDMGITYAHMQLWWQGAQFDPSYEKYYDELQDRFFQFSDASFDIAVGLSDTELIGNPFAAVKLDWSLHRILPEVALMSPAIAPPLHERLRPST
jgi:hypothetical protein